MTEDPMKGTRAEPRVVTRRADFLLSIDPNDTNDTEFTE
jgi:hypothetical protein